MTTQRDMTQTKREDEEATKLAQEQPEAGHDGPKMESDERPRSEEERKPGTTPGANADSHHKAATSKSAANVPD
jgi:hypothetical protein